jgi:hypothetical protein
MSVSDSFCRTGFAKFINSPSGRISRLVAGSGLLLYGWTRIDSGMGVMLIVVGVIPLVAGMFDLCLVSALLGGSIRGAVVRAIKPL